jgi:hypothetical protein
MTFKVPYCEEHRRASKRNTWVLMAVFALALLFSCCVLFAITTSINREPPVVLLVALGLVAVGLAFLARNLFRKALSGSMGAMFDQGDLGLGVDLGTQAVTFTFVNDEIADEFARINQQSAQGTG